MAHLTTSRVVVMALLLSYSLVSCHQNKVSTSLDEATEADTTPVTENEEVASESDLPTSLERANSGPSQSTEALTGSPLSETALSCSQPPDPAEIAGTPSFLSQNSPGGGDRGEAKLRTLQEANADLLKKFKLLKKKNEQVEMSNRFLKGLVYNSLPVFSSRLYPVEGASPPSSGEIRALDIFRGRDTLVHFYATYCLPCEKEYPSIRNFLLEHASELDLDVVFVSHDLRESKSDEQIIDHLKDRIGAEALAKIHVYRDEYCKFHKGWRPECAMPRTVFLRSSGLMALDHSDVRNDIWSGLLLEEIPKSVVDLPSS